jgi:hypothetical protein
VTNKHFTLDEARKHVPWLAQLFADLRPLRERAQELGAETRALEQRIGSNGGSTTRDRLEQQRGLLDEVVGQINVKADAISERGILVKGIEPGLVDFPSLREGREVYLCWREGEAQIDFWHEVDTGFPGRQPL